MPMFDEYLRAHGLHIVDAAPPFPRAVDRAAWDGLPDDRRRAIVDWAERERDQPYPMLSASAFLAFARSGDRQAYERPYFARRRKLIAAVLGECSCYDGRFLDAVVDGIWCVCEESFWGVSAHNGSDHPGVRPVSERALPDVTNPYVDLFATQTAATLALCAHLLGDALNAVSPLIVRRIRIEIERRIIAPFLQRDDFWWMGFIRRDVNNWTPWIVSNVLLCLSLMERDPIRKAEGFARAMRMLDTYLDSLPEDGGCDEGVAYWNVAGGALLDCLELIRHATGGQADFYREPKIRAIARFPLHAHVAGGWFLNFADCDARPSLDGERVYRFGERIGDAALMALGGFIEAGRQDAEPPDTPEFSRVLNRLFSAVPELSPPVGADATLPNTAIWLRRRGDYVAAIKGGHNAESHNHNDVGGFALYKRGEPLVIELGNMVYTRQTFSDGRYALMNTRSRNHNLPLIGEFEQAAGREHAARDVAFTPDTACMDIAPAYPAEAGVRELIRELSLEETGLALTDRIELAAPQPVTWVFMLRTPDARVDADPDLARAIEEMKVDDPRMARSYPGSVWRLTFAAPPATSHLRTFNIQ